MKSLLLLFLLGVSWPVWADPVAVVTRLAGSAALSAPAAGPLNVGSGVAMGDTVTTQSGARVELRFVDGMLLVLGENGSLRIDRLVYDPATSGGDVQLSVDQGAFRVITGSIAKQPDHPFHLITPFATIGVRGTDFWGGPLDDPFAMVTLDGAIVITTPAGTTVLTKGQGIEIKSLGAGTSVPHPWAAEKIKRAVSTISIP